MKITYLSVSNLQDALVMKPHYFGWLLNWSKQDHGLIKNRPFIAVMSYKRYIGYTKRHPSQFNLFCWLSETPSKQVCGSRIHSTCQGGTGREKKFHR